MASFNDFYNYAHGKVWDTDGNATRYTTVQGYSGNLAGQCVSLIKTYLKWGGCGLKAYGNAIDFWTNRNSNGILKYCDVVSGSPRNGDIGVSAGADPRYGHIFIYCNGQQFAQNVGGNPRAALYRFPSNVYGYLRPKFITTYSSSQLINENAIATLTKDRIIKRKGSPFGTSAGELNSGTKIRYTQKWIGNGHRYISWLENSTRYFCAVSGSETAGVDPWATFEDISYDLIEEHAVATLTKDGIRARLNSPTGDVVRSYDSGAQIKYTHKCVGNGHRYIVWTEGNDKIFLAVSGSETQGQDPWATFSTIEDNKTDDTKKDEPVKEETQDPKYTKNVKGYGIDISEHNGSNFDVTGNDFVIIRASWGTNTDKLFKTYVKKCEDAGIPYGVYCYGYPLSDEDAVSEAKYILDLIKDKNVKMGVWYDMEPDTYKEKNNTWNKSLCTSTCKAFCDYVKSKGYFTGVYSSSTFFNTMIDTDYPKWIAQWKRETKFIYEDLSDKCDMFQYTSMGGKLDRDVIYKEISYFASNPIKEEPTPDPKPEEPKPIEPEEPDKPVNPEPTPEPKPEEPEKPSTPEDPKKDNKSIIQLIIEFIMKIINILRNK